MRNPFEGSTKNEMWNRSPSPSPSLSHGRKVGMDLGVRGEGVGAHDLTPYIPLRERARSGG